MKYSVRPSIVIFIFIVFLSNAICISPLLAYELIMNNEEGEIINKTTEEEAEEEKEDEKTQEEEEEAAVKLEKRYNEYVIEIDKINRQRRRQGLESQPIQTYEEWLSRQPKERIEVREYKGTPSRVRSKEGRKVYRRESPR